MSASVFLSASMKVTRCGGVCIIEGNDAGLCLLCGSQSVTWWRGKITWRWMERSSRNLSLRSLFVLRTTMSTSTTPPLLEVAARDSSGRSDLWPFHYCAFSQLGIKIIPLIVLYRLGAGAACTHQRAVWGRRALTYMKSSCQRMAPMLRLIIIKNIYIC